ncbi:MAG: hypothetical protein HYV35_11430 [Lentisphaerae bacterium]|nr:hypothetical protein [Lentisphaerota bacterium]
MNASSMHGGPRRKRDKHRGPPSIHRVFYLPALVIIGSLAATPALWALDASERSFIWNEAQARMAAAATPDDYRRAAITYLKLVNDGVGNGPLFYNLGTAMVQAGETELAIEAFKHAEWFWGAQRDLRHNLKIALARKADSETVEWPWYRLVFFWHFDLPAAARLKTAILAFSIFWLVLTMKLIGIKRGVRAMLVLTVITIILFGSSVVISWHQETTAGSYQLHLPQRDT